MQHIHINQDLFAQSGLRLENESANVSLELNGGVSRRLPLDESKPTPTPSQTPEVAQTPEWLDLSIILGNIDSTEIDPEVAELLRTYIRISRETGIEVDLDALIGNFCNRDALSGEFRMDYLSNGSVTENNGVRIYNMQGNTFFFKPSGCTVHTDAQLVFDEDISVSSQGYNADGLDVDIINRFPTYDRTPSIASEESEYATAAFAFAYTTNLGVRYQFLIAFDAETGQLFATPIHVSDVSGGQIAKDIDRDTSFAKEPVTPGTIIARLGKKNRRSREG